jgi:outer membrane lipoprotein-sorting protein
MMKKHPKIVLALLITGAVALGCAIYLFSSRSLDEEDIIKKTLQKAEKITSYHALLEIITNQGESASSFYAKFWFRFPDCYRVEIFSSSPGEEDSPEQVIVSDGEKSWMFNPHIDDSFELSNFISGFPPYPYSPVVFMQGLAQGQEVELMDVEKTEDGIFYILNVTPQPPAKRHARETVWLDKKTFLPLQIHIFDSSNQLQQRIQFHEIKLNLKLEEGIFKM